MKHFQRVFRALGNSRRLAIIRLLSERKELSVGTIAHVMKLSFTATSRHLNMLASLDLLEKRQESTVVYYRINSDVPREIRVVLDIVTKS